MKNTKEIDGSDVPSAEITLTLIDAINGIGAGEEILVFKDVKQEFMLFTASFNGRITLSMDGGNVQCEFTRGQTGNVVNDFSLAEGILELPLKIVRKDLQGQIQVDGEEEKPVVSEIDGIASEFDAPLMERILKTLEALEFDLEPRPNDVDEDIEHIRKWDVLGGFTLRLIVGEREETITIEATKPDIPMTTAYEFAGQSTDRMPLLVRPTLYGSAASEEKTVLLDLTAVIPSSPYVGQHLVTALSSIIFAMNLWREFEGE